MAVWTVWAINSLVGRVSGPWILYTVGALVQVLAIPERAVLPVPFVANLGLP